MLRGIDTEYYAGRGINMDAVNKHVALDLERGLRVMIHPHRKGEPCLPKTANPTCVVMSKETNKAP